MTAKINLFVSKIILLFSVLRYTFGALTEHYDLDERRVLAKLSLSQLLTVSFSIILMYIHFFAKFQGYLTLFILKKKTGHLRLFKMPASVCNNYDYIIILYSVKFNSVT